MKKLVFFIYAFALVILWCSCEKRVNIEIAYDGDKLVMNTFIQPDSLIYVRVTRSVPVSVYDETAFKEEAGAQVNIAASDGSVLPVVLQTIAGRRFFVSGMPAKAGLQYNISAASSGLQAVSAYDTLPAAPQARDGSAQKSSTRIKFILKDHPGTGNYYRLRVFTVENNAAKSALLFRLDPAFNNNLIDIIANGNSTSLIMDDSRFDGRELTFVLQTQDPINQSDSLMVEVTALTHNAWSYLRTVALQQGNSGVIVSEPIRVFSNVLNGYGIVAGINTKQLVFKVD
ncbi:protein of unknown function [Chitinophaga jiangningensis]|uniref:DUF4249 domain-containing protein n=1 Tax=Chitinophaga jiangningensis TaxID=1419482 RepID=A0A1M6WQK9_9BACT|nr:DUF4249 domain-containing protein [Chitinophaga jiangningensis]SHK95805.1 protein of unknown function [Chitinophaga jiangningensis]